MDQQKPSLFSSSILSQEDQDNPYIQLSSTLCQLECLVRRGVQDTAFKYQLDLALGRGRDHHSLNLIKQ